MKVTKLKNISDHAISINCRNGTCISLPPRESVSNTDVMNMNEIAAKITYTVNVTEVNEPTGLQKLNG